MARKIKETPVLTGKDAQRFDNAIKPNENKKLTDAEYKRLMDSYRRFEVVNPAYVSPPPARGVSRGEMSCSKT